MGKSKNGNKSLVANSIFSSLRTLTTIIFPLITYPYISRVLSVDNMGRINFGQSIVSYFLLLAGLGISTFAIRACCSTGNNQARDQAGITQLSWQLSSR